jgi:hypothetical protein
VDLIQVDSVDVERSRAEDINSVGVIYPGQRTDFILRSPSQDSKDEISMTVQLDQEYERDLLHPRSDKIPADIRPGLSNTPTRH